MARYFTCLWLVKYLTISHLPRVISHIFTVHVDPNYRGSAILCWYYTGTIKLGEIEKREKAPFYTLSKLSLKLAPSNLTRSNNINGHLHSEEVEPTGCHIHMESINWTMEPPKRLQKSFAFLKSFAFSPCPFKTIRKWGRLR